MPPSKSDSLPNSRNMACTKGRSYQIEQHLQSREACYDRARLPEAVGNLLATQPHAAESKRPATGTASGDDYNGDAMMTFERAPKSRTPKFSSSWPIGSNFPGKNVVFCQPQSI